MDVSQFVQVIQTLERNKAKKKPAGARKKNSFYVFFADLEEKFWTALAFLGMAFGAFLYLSGQSFVLADELALYQHTQRVALNSVKELVGIHWFWENYEGGSGSGSQTVELIKPASLVAMDREWRNNRRQLPEIEELLGIVKLATLQRERIDNLKAQRSSTPKKIASVTECHDIRSLGGFKSCFSAPIAVLPKTAAGLNYSRWIVDSFTELLAEITSKLKETLKQQERILKLASNRQDCAKGYLDAKKLVAKIESLLGTAVADLEALSPHSVETDSNSQAKYSFSKKTKQIVSVYDKHND